MDLTELLAVATDCTYGEIEKILLYEQTAADYENFDKRVEFTDFEMAHLDGAKIEMMSASADCFEMYLSDVVQGKTKCYYVKYTPKLTQIFEIRPAKGEIEP